MIHWPRLHARSSSSTLAFMKRIPVESSSLASAGYESNARHLEVEFRHRAIYVYSDVPQDVFDALISADSKGQFFNRYIRDAFAYHPVPASGF
jgi:ATP-dependent DNA helicase RecG